MSIFLSNFFLMPDQKILSTKTVYHSKYFKVNQNTIERNGKTFTKDFIERNPAVLIIPFTQDDEIYIELQFRDALNRMSLELVAGNIDGDEDTLEAAKRELKEEVGLEARNLKKLYVCDLSPSLLSKIHVFAATDIKEGVQKLDYDEEILIQKVPLQELLKKIENGEITSSSHIAAILLFDK